MSVLPASLVVECRATFSVTAPAMASPAVAITAVEHSLPTSKRACYCWPPLPAGEGVHTELSVLHPFPQFGRRLVPAPTEARERSAVAAGQRTNATGDGAAPTVPLYEGGSLADVLAAAAGQRRQAQAGMEGPPVLLFHGVCAWAEGQLEGEGWQCPPLLPSPQELLDVLGPLRSGPRCLTALFMRLA